MGCATSNVTSVGGSDTKEQYDSKGIPLNYPRAGTVVKSKSTKLYYVVTSQYPSYDAWHLDVQLKMTTVSRLKLNVRYDDFWDCFEKVEDKQLNASATLVRDNGMLCDALTTDSRISGDAKQQWRTGIMKLSSDKTHISVDCFDSTTIDNIYVDSITHIAHPFTMSGWLPRPKDYPRDGELVQEVKNPSKYWRTMRNRYIVEKKGWCVDLILPPINVILTYSGPTSLTTDCSPEEAHTVSFATLNREYNKVDDLQVHHALRLSRIRGELLDVKCPDLHWRPASIHQVTPDGFTVTCEDGSILPMLPLDTIDVAPYSSRYRDYPTRVLHLTRLPTLSPVPLGKDSTTLSLPTLATTSLSHSIVSGASALAIDELNVYLSSVAADPTSPVASLRQLKIQLPEDSSDEQQVEKMDRDAIEALQQ